MDTSTPFAFLAQGFLLGLTAAVSPGPLLVYLINQSLAGGWRRGMLVAFAPLISDAPIVIVILLLLSQIPPMFLNVVSLAGGLFVFYLAWSLWKQWRLGAQLTGEEKTRLRGGLGQAVLMNFLSPGPYIFWSLVNGPLLLSALQQSAWHAAAFLFGFYGTFISGMLGLVAIFHQARRFGPRLVRSLLLVSIVILVVFGVMLIYQGLSD